MDDHNKRQRASRACDLCRWKKLKCDKRTAKCSNCKRLGKTCQFSGCHSKRGVPAGLYQLLQRHEILSEALLGCLININPSLVSIIIGILESKDVRSTICLKSSQTRWRESDAYEPFHALLTNDDTFNPGRSEKPDIDLPLPEQISGSSHIGSDEPAMLCTPLTQTGTSVDIRKLQEEAQFEQLEWHNEGRPLEQPKTHHNASLSWNSAVPIMERVTTPHGEHLTPISTQNPFLEYSAEKLKAETTMWSHYLATWKPSSGFAAGSSALAPTEIPLSFDGASDIHTLAMF